MYAQNGFNLLVHLSMSQRSSSIMNERDRATNYVVVQSVKISGGSVMKCRRGICSNLDDGEGVQQERKKEDQ